ncbi:MAG: class I SAM-dependent methyltransferase [bacterium]
MSVIRLGEQSYTREPRGLGSLIRRLLESARSLSPIARREWKKATELQKQIPFPYPSLVIDIGVGSGPFWRQTDRFPRRLIGLDHDPQALLRLPLIWSRKDKHCRPLLLLADATQLPFRNTSKVMLIALGVMEYLDCLENVFSEWRSIGAKGSLLLMSTSPEAMGNWGRKLIYRHLKLISPEEVLKVAPLCGWEVLFGPISAGLQHLWVLKSV